MQTIPVAGAPCVGCVVSGSVNSEPSSNSVKATILFIRISLLSLDRGVYGFIEKEESRDIACDPNLDGQPRFLSDFQNGIGIDWIYGFGLAVEYQG